MVLGPREVMPEAAPPRPPPPRAAPMPARFTPVCWAIIALSVAMFALGAVSPEAHEYGVLYGPRVKAGEWFRVATFLVTHGTSFMRHKAKSLRSF